MYKETVSGIHAVDVRCAYVCVFKSSKESIYIVFQTWLEREIGLVWLSDLVMIVTVIYLYVTLPKVWVGGFIYSCCGRCRRDVARGDLHLQRSGWLCHQVCSAAEGQTTRRPQKAANLRDQRERRENNLFPHVYDCQFQIQRSEKLVAPEQQKKLSRKTKGCVAPAIIPADVTISGQAGKQTISVDL